MSLYTQLYVYILCPFNSISALSEESRNPLILQNYITFFENTKTLAKIYVDWSFPIKRRAEINSDRNFYNCIIHN